MAPAPWSGRWPAHGPGPMVRPYGPAHGPGPVGSWALPHGPLIWPMGSWAFYFRVLQTDRDANAEVAREQDNFSAKLHLKESNFLPFQKDINALRLFVLIALVSLTLFSTSFDLLQSGLRSPKIRIVYAHH